MNVKVYDIDQGKPFDCTLVGCDIFWKNGSVVAELRNRWQGSRDGVVLTYKDRMTLSDAKFYAESLSNNAEEAIHYINYEYRMKKGVREGNWIVKDIGGVVQ